MIPPVEPSEEAYNTNFLPRMFFKVAPVGVLKQLLAQAGVKIPVYHPKEQGSAPPDSPLAFQQPQATCEMPRESLVNTEAMLQVLGYCCLCNLWSSLDS